jgi:hypothetical protein
LTLRWVPASRYVGVSSSLLSVSAGCSGFVSMRTYVHFISFVWIWLCEKLFKICSLLRSRDLKFEGIGSGSDFRERPELCLVFSFCLFSNTSVRRVCWRKGGKRTRRSSVCLLRCRRSHFFTY